MLRSLGIILWLLSHRIVRLSKSKVLPWEEPVQAPPTVKTVVAPVQPVAAPVINCDYEEADFEAVKKTMRAGYPASASNYWHVRFVNARDTYDSCEERRQKSLSKTY